MKGRGVVMREMRLFWWLRRLPGVTVSACGALLAGAVVAQVVLPPVPVPVLVPATAASAGVASVAASAVATMPATAASAAPLQSCSAATDKANAADMKAATAQAQRAELAPLAALVDDAIGQWQQAADACTGRAHERALRNLSDSRKMRSGIAEQQGSGEQCEPTQKDAAALQDLARQAMTERRWPDAALLFRKAEGFWDLAVERCSGNRQQTAATRREQAETDGHNAEFCAPRFDRARETTQKFRNTSAALPPAERQQQSQAAETLWRELLSQCRGNALDIAKAAADGLFRERGTPWVATQAPAAPAAPVLAAVPPSGPVATAKAAAAAPTTLAAATAAPAAAAGGPSAAGPARAIDVMLPNQTHITGALVLNTDGKTHTGNGRIEWANGDVYEGEVRNNLRHGRGEFRWPSGQAYKGDWVEDRAVGQGTMRFANGNLFEGQVDNGEPSGAGVMMYASGDSFRGRFSAGQIDGDGVYTWASGQRCQCRWVNGAAIGPGQLRFTNGNVYTGPLQNGQPHGEGEMRFASGDIYRGRFEQGLIDGPGTYTWQNGDSYAGGWQRGLKEGFGVLTWRNGDRWEGTYHADAQADGELLRK